MSEGLRDTLIAIGVFLMVALASGLGNHFIDGIY